MTVDESRWWGPKSDDLEPLIGVPSVAVAPAPLPDTASDEPEPGIAAEQLAADPVTLEDREDTAS